MRWIYALILVLFVGCSSKKYVEVKLPTDNPTEETTPTNPPTVSPDNLYSGVPDLVLPPQSSIAMKKAKELFMRWGNSDEFFEYFNSKVKTLSGGNYTDPKTAVTDFRKCLSQKGSIEIYWHNYGLFSRALGGYDGEGIAQNSRIDMTAKERAAHWQHEVSHYCGFTHDGNRISPYIEASFPYQVGYKFEEFLDIKEP